MVKAYTDKQLLDAVKALRSFKGIPKDFWLLGVRSDEDAFNRFDDKFYLFHGERFGRVWQGTTNAGTDILNPNNPRGTATLKSNEWFYDAYERRLHRRKVLAWCQRLPMLLHRDNDRDRKSEELGTAKPELVGINIHPATYQIGSKVEREFIQGWSEGCQVFRVRADFDEFMNLTKGQKRLTYCLLKEF